MSFFKYFKKNSLAEVTKQHCLEVSPRQSLMLPFHEAAEPARFALHLKESSIEDYREALMKNANPLMQLAIRTADFVIKENKLMIQFKGAIPKGAKLMVNKTGEKLPILICGQSGKIIKHGRVIVGGAKAAAYLSKAGLLLIEVCHHVSGVDQIRQLKTIGGMVDQLNYHTDSALHAKLEAIYRQAKEILSVEDGGLSAQTVSELSQLSLELMKIRADWRNRYYYQLDSIKAAKSSASSKVLRFNKESSLNKSIDERTQLFFKSTEAIHWMHFSLILQMTLAQYTGRLESFLKHTLTDELHDWGMLSEKTKQRAKEITIKEELPQPWVKAIDRLDATHDLWDGIRNNHRI